MKHGSEQEVRVRPLVGLWEFSDIAHLIDGETGLNTSRLGHEQLPGRCGWIQAKEQCEINDGQDLAAQVTDAEYLPGRARNCRQIASAGDFHDVADGHRIRFRGHLQARVSAHG